MNGLVYALNVFVQIAMLIAAIYIAITRSLTRAVALVVVVGISYYVTKALATWVTITHEKGLTESERMQIALHGVPGVWLRISAFFGALFFGLAVASIWYFLN